MAKCAFCGKQTNYFFWELHCYICISCLAEYKKKKGQPKPFSPYSSFPKEVLFIDEKKFICPECGKEFFKPFPPKYNKLTKICCPYCEFEWRVRISNNL